MPAHEGIKMVDFLPFLSYFVLRQMNSRSPVLLYYSHMVAADGPEPACTIVNNGFVKYCCCYTSVIICCGKFYDCFTDDPLRSRAQALNVRDWGKLHEALP